MHFHFDCRCNSTVQYGNLNLKKTLTGRQLTTLLVQSNFLFVHSWTRAWNNMSQLSWQNLISAIHSYHLQIIVEMLKSITTGDLGREQCVSMHVWHQARGCVPTHSTPARQKQRATGSAQDPIHPGHKVTYFPEQEKIQLPVITTVQHYSLQGKWGGTHTQVRRCTANTQTNAMKPHKITKDNKYNHMNEREEDKRCGWGSIQILYLLIEKAIIYYKNTLFQALKSFISKLYLNI